MNVAECSAGWSGQGQVIRKYHNYLTWHVVSRQDKTSRHVIFSWMFGTRPGEAIMIESLLMSLLVVNGDDEEGGSFQLVGWHRASLITDYGWWVSFIEAQNPLFHNYHYHWHHHFRPKMSSEKGFLDHRLNHYSTHLYKMTSITVITLCIYTLLPGKGFVDHWVKDEHADSCHDCTVRLLVLAQNVIIISHCHHDQNCPHQHHLRHRLCLFRFTIYERRHHCRNCGKLYCSSCSRYQVELSPWHCW